MTITVPANISTSKAKLPRNYEEAKTAIASCYKIDECLAAYTLDDDGERSIKRTEMLSHLEFKRAIALRERQLTSDTEALQALRGAHGKVKTIWDKHPDKNFGEICELYKAKAAAA